MSETSKPALGQAAEFFDRFGADRSAWPFAGLAEQAGRGIADPADWRRAEVEAAGLARRLAELSRMQDREIAAAGSLERIAGTLSPNLPRRPGAYARWVALAATIVIAAGLGSLADVTFRDESLPGTSDAVLGSQLLGPAEVGLQ